MKEGIPPKEKYAQAYENYFVKNPLAILWRFRLFLFLTVPVPFSILTALAVPGPFFLRVVPTLSLFLAVIIVPAVLPGSFVASFSFSISISFSRPIRRTLGRPIRRWRWGFTFSFRWRWVAIALAWFAVHDEDGAGIELSIPILSWKNAQSKKLIIETQAEREVKQIISDGKTDQCY